MKMLKRFVIYILSLGAFIAFVMFLGSKDTKTPQEFQYKKHDYIYFPDKGIIHSPECRQCTLTFETI